MRSLFRVGLFLAAIAVGLFVSLAGQTAQADLIASSPTSQGVAVPSGNAAQVADQLRGAGLSDAEVAQRIDQLQPSDVEVLTENPQQLQVAGDPLTIGIIIGGLLLLCLILYFVLHEKL